MFKKIINFFPVLLKLLPLETAKKALDAALDIIEADVIASKGKIDDFIILPMVAIIRKVTKTP
ncbi:MAG TPA: hypothetical protein VMV77_09235 [Bacteroidales bacterium]|nr:hypothetical protein [Bacteroidales bacterium]